MTLANRLLAVHVALVVFSLAGLLIAMPNPDLWAGSAAATWVFAFGMQYAGALHIGAGAAAVFAGGVAALGWRRTGLFCAAALTISLGCELLGTSTGVPFGAYEYTYGLGPKVFDRVPVAIPLSWFSIGLTSYLLAHAILARLGVRRRTWAGIALGAWLLTAWDLVLDPAMASEALPVKFWVWHRSGPYFGMPVQNLIGWTATGVLFIAAGRFAWGGDPDPRRIPVAFLLVVYGVNMAFAIALSLAAGLWLPVPLALASGLAPALLAWDRGAAAAPAPRRWSGVAPAEVDAP